MINIADKNTWFSANAWHNAAPAWLKQLQQRQAEEFVMPEARSEVWKYTDVTQLAKKNYTLPASAIIAKHKLQNKLLAGAINLVFVNGHFNAAFSELEQLPADIIATSLAVAWDNYAQVLETYFRQDFKQQPFAKLNTALVQDGAFIHVPKNKAVNTLVHLLFINDDLNAALVPVRNLIIVEESAQIAIAESYISIAADNGFTNAVTQIVAGKNATVHHTKLQNQSLTAQYVAYTHIKQQADSYVKTCHFGVGSQLAREDIQVNLQGTGAHCELIGLYAVNHNQHIDYHTCIEHSVPYTQSNEFFKGVLNGKAKGVFNGKVIVHPDAQKTNASQANHNLLLTKTAEVNAKPELEIYADDVQCAHGATVGQLDEAALFYLQSRGIAQADAFNLLIAGFVDEVIAAVKSNVMRSYIRQALNLELTESQN